MAAVAVVALPAAWYVIGWARQRLDTRPPPALTTMPATQAAPARRPPAFKRVRSEHLRYTVAAKDVPLGAISIDIGPLTTHAAESPVYPVTYSLQTNEAFSPVYILTGEARVLLDAGTLLPLEYEHRVRSGPGVTGGREKYRKLEFDRTRHVLRCFEKEKDQAELTVRKPRPIPAGSHHFASVLFFLRHAPLKVGTTRALVVVSRKRNVSVRAAVLREEPYQLTDGTKGTAVVLLSQTDFGKKAIRNAEFRAWLDKAERFLVRLDVQIAWGTITATLVERTPGEGPAPQKP